MARRPPVSTKGSPKSRLLAGSALAAALLVAPEAATAQTLPAIPDAASIVIPTGGAQPVITAPDANTLDIDLNASRTVINWASFHVSGADRVTFHFGAASDIVLNKSPTAVRVDAGGQVSGLVDGAGVGGNIWFYSPAGVVISPGAVMTAGNFVFARGDAIVDMTFVDAAAPLSVLQGASNALLQINAISTATSASINATGDLVLSASTGEVSAATAQAAGTATISAAAGSVFVSDVTAGGAATVSATGGEVSLGSASGSTVTATATTGVSVTTATSGSGDVVLTAGTTASLGSVTSARDVRVSGPAASLGSGSAAGDVFVTATTGVAAVTGSVTAGDDIEVTATTGNVSVTGGLTSTGAGAADETHVLAKSTGGATTVNSATTQGTGAALGDVRIEAATTGSLTTGTSSRDVMVAGGTSASLATGTAGRSIQVGGPSATLGSGSAVGDVFVTATTGIASVTGTVTAGDDIEVTATTGNVSANGSLTSTGVGATDETRVLIRSTGGSVMAGSAATQGTGAALGDVTVEAATSANLSDGAASRDVVVTAGVTATLGSAAAGRDIQVLGPAATLGSGAATGDVFVTATSGAASVTGVVTAGDDIEVTATTGSVEATGSLTSTGVGAGDETRVLARSTSGSVTVGSAATQGTGAARGDVTIEGATAASLGSGASSRDLRVLGPSASLGSANVTGDVFVTATTGTASVTGAVTAGDDIEVTATTGSVSATGSLTSTGVGATDETRVLVRSTSASVSVGSAATQGMGAARGDVTIEGATSASLASGASSRDLKVLGPSATLGSASVTGDVFVTATTGTASVTGAVTAGDDIEVTATTGNVSAGGSLTSTGVGATDETRVLVRSTGGSVSVGAAATQGTGAARGDVTIEGATTAGLGSGGSSRDLRVIGPSASLGSADVAGDIFVTATTGVATVSGAVSAGDDIEVTATTGIVAATGALTTTGVGATDDARVLVRSTGGAVMLGSATTQGAGAAAGDVVVDGSTTATVTGAVNASRDVVVVAGQSVSAGGSTMSAARDLSVRATAADVTVGTVRAGDDIALRALTGRVTATGDVEAGRTEQPGDPDVQGAADDLAVTTLTGHDVDILAQSVAITGHVAAGRAPIGNETLGAAQLASDVIVRVSDPDNGATPALRLATGAGKAVTAHQDIVLRAENAAKSSILTGDVFAARDVAILSLAGDVTLRSARAGDDIVLRAPSGAITVNGDLQAGRDRPGMTPTDAHGAADDLNLTHPLLDFDGNPATLFKVVGFDVSLVAQAVKVTGSTIAGRQPSTDDPDTAGPADASTSDVRIQTRLSLTPVTNLVPNIELGAVTATRDLQLDSFKAITAGDLRAGRDIAVLGRGGVTPGAAPGDRTGAGVTLGSARAGDDALAFSIFGRSQILGGITSGAPFLRLTPTNDRIIDGATEAADQLAIYLRYFDLDEASAPYVLTGGVIHIAGEGVTVGGPMLAQGALSDIRVRSSLDIDVSGAASAGRFAVFQTDAGAGGAVKVGAVSAGREVLLDGVGVEATGLFTATDGDVAVRGRDGGAVSLAGASAGDDVVVRTTGAVTNSGPITAGGGTDGAGLGDALAASEGVITLEGQAFDLAGRDIDIRAGSVSASGAMTAAGTTSDVRVQSGGVITLGAASAGRDVLVDGGAAVTTGLLGAGRDVAVRSTGDGAVVTVGGADAGDDVVLRARGALRATGPLNAGSGSDSVAADQAGDLTFSVAKSDFGGELNLTGRNIDLRSSAGSIEVTGAVTAATDARFQTAPGAGAGITAASVTAGRDVLLDGASVTATGTLTATDGDVAARGRDGGAMSLAGLSAGDDVVLRTTGAITLSGPVTSGGGTDGAGLGDMLLVLEGAVTLEGRTFDLAGRDIDIRSGSVSASGAITANGATSDVRMQSGGAITLGAATAGRDVLIDGGAAVSTGLLNAGRDVGVRSIADGAQVTVGGASAGDDVVVRARGAIRVTGPLNAGAGVDSADSDQAGDLMFGVARSRLAGDLDLAGRSVDLRSSAGGIEVTGATTSATDARFQTAAGTGGAVKVAGVTAGRDILLDGSAASGALGAEATGSLLASGGDVAVRARDGSSLRVLGVTASDDVALRATGTLTGMGTVATLGGASTPGMADRLTDATEAGRLTVGGVSFDLNSSDIDVVGGSVNVLRTAARGSSRIKAGAVSINGGADVGVDILIDSETSLTVGDLKASGDIALRSRSGSLTTGSLEAGDDIVLRGLTGVTALSLKANGFERIGVADQLYLGDPTSLGGDFSLIGGTVDIRAGSGSITLGRAESTGDVRLQAAGGDVSVSGLVQAGRDIFLEGAAVSALGGLNATGDVALYARSGAVALGSVSAGDDIVVRAVGDVSASGELKSGQGADVDGVGDRLLAAAGESPLFGATFGAAGGVIDMSGANVRLTGAILASGEAAHLRLKSMGVAVLGDATLSGDIAVEAVGDITGGALVAGRDLALRSSEGAVSLGSGSAGDDIVLRAARRISITGALSAGQGVEADGVADTLFALDRTNPGGDFTLVGRHVDMKSAAEGLSAARVTAAGDVRMVAGGGGRITAGDVQAGGDVVMDGGSVTAGDLLAGADIAVRASTGNLDLGSARAGDDLVLRAQGDIRTSGALATQGGAEVSGAGDRLAALDGAALAAGRQIDIQSNAGGLAILGAVTTTDDIRLAAQGTLRISGGLTAGADVLAFATGDLTTTGAIQAGRDARLDGASVTVGGAVRAGRDARLKSAGAVSTRGDLEAGRDVSLEGAAIGVGGGVRVGRDARLTATGALTLTGRVQADRDAALEGASVTATEVRAGRDAAVRARSGDIVLSLVTAGDDVVLRASRNVTVTGSVTAGGGTDGTGEADTLYATDRTALAGEFDLAGGTADIRARGDIRIGGALSAARDVRVQTVGDGEVTLAAVTAGADALVDGRAVRVAGAITAGRDAAVRARAGAVDLAGVTAGDDIAIRASGAVKVSGPLASGGGANAEGAADRLVTAGEGGMIRRLTDPLATAPVIEGFALGGGDIDIRSGADMTLTGDASATGTPSGIRLQAAGKLTVAGLSAGDMIFARAADFSLGGAWRAQRARIEAVAPGGLALGEGVSAPSGGVAFSSAQLARIEAATVQIFVGDSSSAMRGGNVNIGTLTVDTAKIRTALELYAGGTSDVLISGALAPLAGGENRTTLRIGAPDAAGGWTPRSLRIVANSGGSIGSAFTTGGRVFTDVRAFNVVELNVRGDILMGHQDFIDRLATTPSANVPGVVKTLIAPQTATGSRILLTAGSLILRADGKVAQQDTGGLLGTTPTGLYLLGTGAPQLILGRISATSGLPEFIELNGALTSGNTIMTGQSVSLANGIAFDRSVTPSPYYRLNTCAILQPGSCMPSNGHPTISIPPEQLTGLQLEDRTAAAGTADPTVASATNEEVWKDPN